MGGSPWWIVFATLLSGALSVWGAWTWRHCWGQRMQKWVHHNPCLEGGCDQGEVAGCEQIISVGQASQSMWAAMRKYHRLGGLQTTEICFSWFWSLEVWDQDGCMVWRRALSRVTDLSLCPHRAEGTRELCGVSLIRTLIPSWELHPRDPSTSCRPHFLIPTPWTLGFQHRSFGEHTNIQTTAVWIKLKHKTPLNHNSSYNTLRG